MYKALIMGGVLSCASLFGDMPRIETPADVEQLFTFSLESLQEKESFSSENFKKHIKEILAVETPSFANTLLPLDRAIGELITTIELYVAVAFTNPNEAVRNFCHEGENRLQALLFDTLYSHPELYTSCLYVKEHEKDLSTGEMYFLDDKLEELQEMGCHLPKDKREELSALQGEINTLCSTFEKNIREDNSCLLVEREELIGLDDAFLESLEVNESGQYKLTCDYPVYFPVMKHCEVSSTRKGMHLLFVNRAHPANAPVLNNIIAKRDHLGKLLGFNSYADADLNSQMVKSVDRAQGFLNNLQDGISDKLGKEVTLLKENLPEGVTLTEDQKIRAYDTAFISSKYQKEHLQVDDRKISEYFPLENTLAGLISVYEEFFSLTIQEEPGKFWDESIKLLSFKKKGSDKTLGYLLLDLFPRENKYTHACQISLLPAYEEHQALALVITNFPKKTKSRPSLLTHGQVTTLFHEFGHAIHSILGRGEFVLLSGTNVKRDFVELPSQLLEEWLWDPAILQKVSSHYETGQTLPQESIDGMLKARNTLSALWVGRQCYHAKLALSYFAEGPQKDCYALAKKDKEQMATYIAYEEDDHFYLAFGHLTGYGAKYYGYLWSKVFALDVFADIAKEGLLNPSAGNRYVNTILGKGGAEDPEVMLENFLERKPSQQAFLKAYGL